MNQLILNKEHLAEQIKLIRDLPSLLYRLARIPFVWNPDEACIMIIDKFRQRAQSKDFQEQPIARQTFVELLEHIRDEPVALLALLEIVQICEACPHQRIWDVTAAKQIIKEYLHA